MSNRRATVVAISLVLGVMTTLLLQGANLHGGPRLVAHAGTMTPDQSGVNASPTPDQNAATEAGTVTPVTTVNPAAYHQVLPHDTDPAIDMALDPHVAGAPACPVQRGLLLVYFPGTGGRPASSSVRAILDVATGACMHAIGLSYPDDQAVWDVCSNNSDPDCYEKWRLEKLDGIHRSPYVNVGRPNSIENRLQKALAYLAATYPQEGWGAYLDGDNVRWDKLVLAGHSQGGGMAAIAGQVHAVARVAMFGAVTDAIGGFDGPPPPWLAKPTATPQSAYYGFAHMDDQWSAAEQKGWAALNLPQFGQVVNVDTAASPFDGSHMLTTDVQWNHSVPNGAHPTVVSTANAARFAQVWQYLLIPDQAGSTPAQSPGAPSAPGP